MERAVPDLSWEYLHAQPTKTVAGMEVLADGVDWDPGAIGVAGKYRRNETNTAWNLIEATAVSASLVAGLANKFLVQGTSGTSIPNAQFMGSLTTGLVKNTLTTGVQSIAVAGTDYEAPIAAGTTAQYWRGDKSWQTLNATAVGLGNVTNDAQTKAAVMPNTAPGAGQIAVGNAGGTAYAPVTASGAVTLASTGAFSLATPATLTVSTANAGGTTAHTHAITSSSAPGAAASLLATDASGIIGTTATRIVKIWAIDLTVTNTIAGSVNGNAATVTTNANLTGPITSSGNATAIASQTGTGTKFVVDTSPTLVTPNIGAATGTSATLNSAGVNPSGAFTSSGSTGTVTITDTGANGGNLKITGDGVTTPNKYVRVTGGVLQVGNSAYTQIILALTDAGNLSAVGSILSSNATGGIGYATGAGGTITQLTNKATGVTLSKACGQITMNAAALAASTTVSFTLTNTAIAATDTIDVHRASGGTAAAYNVWCDSVAAGSCVVCVRNISAGSLSEAVVLNFSICKGVSS